MSYILSLDLGTTNIRAVLFDEEKRVVGTAEEELVLYCPRPGWVEQDPLEMVEHKQGFNCWDRNNESTGDNNTLG